MCGCVFNCSNHKIINSEAQRINRIVELQKQKPSPSFYLTMQLFSIIATLLLFTFKCVSATNEIRFDNFRTEKGIFISYDHRCNPTRIYLFSTGVLYVTCHKTYLNYYVSRWQFRHHDTFNHEEDPCQPRRRSMPMSISLRESGRNLQ